MHRMWWFSQPICLSPLIKNHVQLSWHGAYLWRVNEMLDNPVYYALRTGDHHFAEGEEGVLFFPEEVSPYAGFALDTDEGFARLAALLPRGRRILYATRDHITVPAPWRCAVMIEGTQFVCYGKYLFPVDANIQPLGKEHVPEMTALTRLTRPGPFGPRTIEFGNYHGIFSGGQLASMAGERLHPGEYAEISAVCTHPDHLGKGYAVTLMKHLVTLILQNNKVPFLHVRADNERAISVYERVGFTKNGPMNFYFCEKT